jgi:hypothetical protein
MAALLSASCVESAPAGPIATLIPSDAIAAIVVESPYKLYAAAELAWKASGLDAMAGSDLQGLLKNAVPGSSDALETLDFARPWAMAVLPTSGSATNSGAATSSGASTSSGAKKTREVLYLPFRSSPEALVAKLFGDGSMKQVAKAKGYVVLSDVEGQIAFPPAKGADLSRLGRYPASAVKLWGDPAGIRRATSDGYKPIAEAVRRFVSDPKEAKPGSAASLKAMGELGLSFIAQLGLADASIEPGASGLTIRVGASALKGSDLEKLLAVASLGPSSLDWAGQVDSGALYGLAWSIDPTVGAGLYQNVMGGLLSSMGLSGDIVAKAAALQAKWSKAGGPRGAMSFDLDLDADALAGLKGSTPSDAAAKIDQIKKAVSIKFDLFQDVKDEAAYRVMLKSFATDPDYQAFSKAYADAFGISIAVSNQDRKDGNFAYGELGIKLKVTDGEKLGALGGNPSSKEGAETALGILESLVSLRWEISGGRFVATSGDPAALRVLSLRKGAEHSLAADPTFAAFAKTMPPKTVLVGSLSMKKLMGLVGSITRVDGHSGQSSMPDPEGLGSWYSYLAADSRGTSPGVSSPGVSSPGLEAGMLVPASDIGSLARSAGAFKKPAPAPSANGGT